MQPKRIAALVAVVAVIAALAFSPLQGILARQLSTPPQVAVAPSPTMAPAALATSTPVPMPTSTPIPEPTPVPPTPTPAPAQSLLAGKTWLTIYGRAFEAGPILGRLANYKNLDDMAAEVNPWIKEIKQVNGGKEVVPVVHLIYGMAIPCEPDNDCLFYLDSAGFPLVEDYIKPALERGYQVILDTQLGASNPVAQVKRMISKGYLDYPNVHVAIDPEFHLHPGEDLPGIPIGQIDASDVNAVQQLLDELVVQKNLPKKVLIVHQFGDANVNDGNPFMITNKKAVKTFSNVDLVIDADGFGKPGIKVKKYNQITDHEEYPFIQFRAIKLFFFNPHEERHHGDNPVMTWPEVFGVEEVVDGVRMNYHPDIIVVA